MVRKLRLALPKGELINPNKWNVSNILKLAGIGDYYVEGRDICFRSNDPEIEVTVINPWDIPGKVLHDGYDLGITGKDISVEQMNNTGNTLEEICDLKCGAADICFITTREVAKEISNFGLYKYLTKRFREYTLEWNSDKINRPNLKSRLKISTTYQRSVISVINKLISNFWRESRNYDDNDESERGFYNNPLIRVLRRYNSRLRFRDIKDLRIKHTAMQKTQFVSVIKSDGCLEQQLSQGDTDFIIDVVATGESIKKRNLEVLGTLFSTSARLYQGSSVSQEDSWKQGKIQDIKDRIERVLIDIEKYCQVNIKISGEYKIFEKRSGLKEEFLRNSIDTMFLNILFSEKIPQIAVHSDQNEYFWGSNKIEYSIIMEKRNLPIILKLLQSKRFLNSDLEIRINSGSVFNLNKLFSYCPILSTTSLGESDLDFDYDPQRRFTFGNICYPCCDSSKLRPEHREAATIFTFENGQFQINPKYSEILSAS